MASQFPNSMHFLTYRHSLRSYASILYLRLPSNFSRKNDQFVGSNKLSTSAASGKRHLLLFETRYPSEETTRLPLLLFLFVVLTWISLRFQQTSSHISVHTNTRRSYFIKDRDADANLVRFSTVEFPSKIFKDQRGWILNPVTTALEAGISGGAQSCVSSHMGEIRPGSVRGNHRHHTCNETFVFWGADTLFRLENQNAEGKGYFEIFIGSDEVAIAASPVGTAHALINVDSYARPTFFFGCQDSILNYSTPTTDFKTWDDI